MAGEQSTPIYQARGMQPVIASREKNKEDKIMQVVRFARPMILSTVLKSLCWYGSHCFNRAGRCQTYPVRERSRSAVTLSMLKGAEVGGPHVGRNTLMKGPDDVDTLLVPRVPAIFCRRCCQRALCHLTDSPLS